jgi:hypothetical protein
MAGIGNSFLDLRDKYKQENPDGSIADVIDMLMQLNPMMEDAVAVACNNGTTHRHTVLTGYPDVAWGRLYKGIAQSKATREQVDDTTGFVEGLSTVDERLIELAGATGAALRLTEANAFLEAIANEVAATLIYGNDTSAPEEFMGLDARFNALTGADNSNQIVSAGGSGSDNTSVWFVTWADHACQMLYPEGTTAGVQRIDRGRQRVLDGASNPYYVLEEQFTQHCGLAVKDWRYVSRIFNIDVSNMQADPSDMQGDASNNSLFKYMRQAYWKLQSRRQPQGGKLCIYANRDVLEALDALSSNAGGTDNFVRLSTTEVEGKEVTTYRGIPLRETDAILNTESAIS